MGSRHLAYNHICTVSVKLLDGDEKLEGTASGILIDSKHGLVLSHTSLLYPLAHKLKKGKLNSLRKDGVMDKNCFDDKLEIEVTLPNDGGDLGENGVEKEITNIHPSLLNCNVQEVSSLSRFKANLKMVFECRNLRKTVEKILPSDSWQFVDDLSGGQKRGVDKSDSNKTAVSNEELCFFLMPCFVILKLCDFSPANSFKDSLLLRNAEDNEQGDPVEICATPFGGLSPEVFLNSRSQGIISNLAGPKGVLLMTDARCIPGSEGGGLFYCYKGNRILTGVMIASLCWKNNEWVGLSMACAISEVIGSLQGHISVNSGSMRSRDTYITNFSENFINRLVKQVVCVRVGHSWGSGVNINPASGLYLTCSHVLKGVDYNGVQVSQPEESVGNQCKVVYQSPVNQQFDIGLIELVNTKMPAKDSIPVNFSTVEEGDLVYVIGHALFRDDLHLKPTVTMGIVTKVIRYNTIPVMIQTTCAVHAGASGGAVYDKHGHLVAIAVCNSKDTVTGACYPHVNMCIPMETIASVITNYISTKDKTVLQALHIENKRINKIWSIGNEAEAVMSRL